MKILKKELKESIKNEIINILSEEYETELLNEEEGESIHDKIYSLISRANLSDDAKNIMEEWLYHTDNPQAIVDYLESIIKETMVVDKNTNPTTIKDKDPNTVKTAVDAAKKTGKPVTIAEEDDDMDDEEMDKKATKAASSSKKDSIVSIANKLQKLTAEMKKLANEYKTAKSKEDKNTEKQIVDKLRELTKEKKNLEKQLS